MTTLTELTAYMQELFGNIADEEGRASGFIQRERELSGSGYAKTLVFGWMSNAASRLSELTQAAGTMNIQISKQGLAEWFSEKSAHFMQRLLERSMYQLIEGEVESEGLLGNFTSVHVQDSTSIVLPAVLREQWAGCNQEGSGSAGLKISVDWDVKSGGITGIHLQAAKAADQQATLAQHLPPSGSLQIRDLGYFNLKYFAEQIKTGSDFLTRFKVNTKVYTLDGQSLDWLHLLSHYEQDTLAMNVLIGQQRLPCRLLAWRVPDEVLQQRQAQLRTRAIDHACPVSPARWQSAAWTIYITNAPPERLSLTQAASFMKIRWQIENLFKIWKSHGLLDESRSANPWRILTECFAKLLALLIQHACCLLAPRNLPYFSWLLAYQLVQKQAFHLAATLSHPTRLHDALSLIQFALPACKRSASLQRPSSFWALVVDFSP